MNIDGVTPFVLQIHLEKDYRFTSRGAFEGKVYRPFCVAWHQRRHQEEVVYQGIDGPDKGRWLVCTLDDWATRFQLIEEEKPTAEVAKEIPDRGQAGHASTGSGA